MKKPIVVLLHAAYWLMYLSLFAFLYFINQATHGISALLNQNFLAILLIGSATGVLSFYSFYWLLVPGYLAKGKIRVFALLALLVCTVVAMLTTSLISFYIYRIISIVPEPSVSISLMLGFTFFAAVNGVLGALLRGFITWYAEIRVKEALVKKNLQTELALLKTQINPHFLFNTLNNIDVLIEKDARAASAYLNHLSDLLRFMLYETQSERIPLGKELEYIRKYIALQKIRTLNEHFVNLTVTGSADQVTVAPMIFIPFIENAFKHATNKKIGEAITIGIAISEQEVQFTCVNVFDKNKRNGQAHSGLGNELIRQRLDLLYQKKHMLHIYKTEDTFNAHLTIPLDDTQLHHH